ncbi:Peptidyl-prolyl cis-trans isomerase cyp15 [Coemansia interrupta]|uniref:peptidylprolyl isomerase n=1 Tax=Coemansia interrupta TaxID=1126814 RepID=A0A9W8LIH1_9FUNG|nr:Peptidyl-prolyl cis-trans isomerase cyp15 [Coemansia interrupta]
MTLLADVDKYYEHVIAALPSTGKRAAPSSTFDAKRIERLPCAQMYERSYMHRDTVDFVVATKTGFVITISADGHVKFWKKRDKGIEFVKDFRAHMGAVTAHALSSDGMSFATASTDKQVKIFDIVNFDMIGIISVGCLPGALCWVTDSLDQSTCVAVADSESPAVYLFDPYGDGEPKRAVKEVHRQPVKLMEYNTKYKCVVSVDSGGMVEYWTLDERCGLPSSVDFSLKSQTDLYEFKKNKYTPTSMTLSPDNELFVCTSPANTVICVFKFASGKLYRKYDESIEACNAIQQSGKAEKFKLDDMEFGRRMAVENELLRASSGRTTNAVFDESAGYLAFASLFGIKIVNLVANKAVSVLGKPEPYRFVNIALIQSIPDNASRRVDLAASANPAAQKPDIDPTIFCTAFKKNRFYMFTRDEPDHTEQGTDRDIFNEKPTREEASLAIASKDKRKTARSAVIRTTVGDIHLALFPELAPKAVENFAVHSQNGYYNGVIFHRVIKRFMIQTGDPLGDGTGGESIWKRPFEDEFTPKLRHDRPFTLSMANAGPGTNGSQFFLTTVDSAPWLDDKHTIFGRATSGADVIHAIEAAKTDKRDKPFEDISIMNIQINHD